MDPGAVATEPTDHITHAETRRGAAAMSERVAVAAADVADIIAFAVTPRRTSLNETLVRPTVQP